MWRRRTRRRRMNTFWTSTCPNSPHPPTHKKGGWWVLIFIKIDVSFLLVYLPLHDNPRHLSHEESMHIIASLLSRQGATCCFKSMLTTSSFGQFMHFLPLLSVSSLCSFHEGPSLMKSFLTSWFCFDYNKLLNLHLFVSYGYIDLFSLQVIIFFCFYFTFTSLYETSQIP